MLKNVGIGLAGAALVSLLAVVGRADEPAKKRILRLTPGKAVGKAVVVVTEKGEKTAPKKHVDLQIADLKITMYWLGLGCHPVSGAMQSQLELPEDQGLVVKNVVPDGPAAKAGIQKHDILLSVGDKPLKKIQDLIGAVEEAKEGELSLKVIRKGKAKTITVTPEKRPKEAHAVGVFQGVFDDADAKVFRKWNKLLQPKKGDMRTKRLRYFHPGAILPPGVPPHPPLPAGLKITITKQGDKPANVVVERGDDKWEVTEKKLDKLPKDIRPHIERMLGRGPHVGVFEARVKSLDFGPEMGVPGHPGLRLKARVVEPVEKRLEKRLEQINRRMEKLHKAIEKLQNKQEDEQEDTEDEED